MALRRDPVVDAGAQREHKAVLGCGKPLHAMRLARGTQRVLQLLDVRRRRPLVGFGTGEVAFAVNPGHHTVRRVGPVGGHVGAVDRRDAGQAIRKIRRSPHHDGPAHAVTHRADAPRVGVRLRVDELQQRLGVAARGGGIERIHQREHVRHGRLGALLQEVVARAAVVQIGQHDEVAHAGQAPRHVMQLFALARSVHVEQHHGKRPAFFGMHDE